MEILTDVTRVIDLSFLGRPHVIATAVVETPAGIVLVDPGPSTCLDRLHQELAAEGIVSRDLHALLLTHIHLDHAGASGSLVRIHPHLRVYVHERGAPHLVDPAKLLASAARLYGADMARLWGESASVPSDRITRLAGGECLSFGSSEFDVAYTPGHASHHVSFRHRQTGIAFVGDTAGIRIGSEAYVLPPTPPPDIAFDGWRQSLAVIRDWDPAGLFVTHFGLKPDVDTHLASLEQELDYWQILSGQLVAAGLDDAAQARRFIENVSRRIAERAGTERSADYLAAVPLEHCWMGLARYWRKRVSSAPRTGVPIA